MSPPQKIDQSTEVALFPGAVPDDTTLPPPEGDTPRRPVRSSLTGEELLAGRFRILHFLGRGGMGEVFAAQDVELEEQVALKLLLSTRSTFTSPCTQVALARFRREIHLARRVTHPNVCRTYDVFHHRRSAGEELVFLTMELLTGETLAARLQREGPLPLGVLLPILHQLVAALDAAHQARVVHRDFKSGNVMLVPVPGSDEVRAVVTDFGLARSATADKDHTVTREGVLVGSKGYVAPELFDGQPATPAADIYSLGVVLHEMLTGHRPRLDERFQLLPPSQQVEGLHPVWDEVVARCLAEEPHHRFESAGNLLAALDRVEGCFFLDPEPATSRRARVARLERLLLQRERRRGGEEDPELEEHIDRLVQQLMAEGRRGVGDTVAGTRLLRPIGSGNFATIWLAERLADGARVATKIFHLDKLGQGIMVWRFRRSLRAMSLITQHRERPINVVTIHQAAEDGLAFSMDYLEGGDLEDVARRGWSLEKKLDLFVEICCAVAFAHRLGVIHRDIKPANVVLDAAGRPVLTDFDIADIRFVTRLSVSGGGLGTPVFAAPEQLEDSENADERSDIYSLGRLLYYLLLERSPGIQIERDPELINLNAYPPALVAVVRRAVQWQPEDRFPHVEALVAAVLEHRRLHARLRAYWGRARRWMRRNAAVLTIMALLVTGAVGFGLYHRQAAERLKQAHRELEAVRRQMDQFHAELQRHVEARQSLTLEISRLEADLEILDLRIQRARGEERRKLLETRRATEGELADKQHLDEELRGQIERVEGELWAAKARVDALLHMESTEPQAALPPPSSRPPPPPTAPSSSSPRKPDPSPPPSSLVEERRPPPVAPVAVAPTPLPPPVEPWTLAEITNAVQAGDRAALPHLAARGRVETDPALLVALAWAVESLGSDPRVAEAIRQRAGIETRTVLLDGAPLRLVRIPGGTLEGLDGGPVQVAPFWMGETEVTRGQWAAVMGQAVSGDPREPVDRVSWQAARDFCERLTARQDKPGRYRLPTEAEWLLAATAIRQEDKLDRRAWHRGNSGKEPRAVALLPPDRHGLHDLFGNVWEWVETRHIDSRLPKKDRRVPQQLIFSGGSFTYLPLRYGGASDTSPAEFAEAPAPMDLSDAVRREGFRVVWQEAG